MDSTAVRVPYTGRADEAAATNAGASPPSGGNIDDGVEAEVRDQDEEISAMVPVVPSSVTNDDENEKENEESVAADNVSGALCSSSKAACSRDSSSDATDGTQENGEGQERQEQEDDEMDDDTEEFSNDGEGEDAEVGQPRTKRRRMDEGGNDNDSAVAVGNDRSTAASTTCRPPDRQKQKDEDAVDDANGTGTNAATVTTMGVEDEDQRGEEEEQQRDVVNASSNDGNGIKNDGDGGQEDDEVQVMSPPKSGLSQQQKDNDATDNAVGNTTYDADDEIQIESCNVTNPGIQYPHVRDQCGVFRFSSTRNSGGGSGSGNSASTSTNAQYCPKCYCYVCDVKASECAEWNEHCDANSGDVTWTAIRQLRRNGRASADAGKDGAGAGAAGDGEVVLIEDSPEAAAAGGSTSRRRVCRANVASHQAQQQQRRRARERMEVLANIMGGTIAPVSVPVSARSTASAAAAATLANTDSITGSSTTAMAESDKIRAINQLVAEQLLGAAANGGDSARTSGAAADRSSGGERRARTRDQMRITEVLSENFRRVLVLSANASVGIGGGEDEAAASSYGRSLSSTQSRRKMEGDIPQLGLHGSFFVEGIKIGWPYPMVMQPQRQVREFCEWTVRWCYQQ